jgi:integrase
VWSPRDRKHIRKTFLSVAEARDWRQETQVAVRRGLARSPSPLTLKEAADGWLVAAEAGVVRTRSGEPYKPSALRSYREALNKVLPELGHLRITALTRNHVQDVADRMVAAGAAPSSVRNAVLPLRAIYRRAVARGEVPVNPTLKLCLPAVRGRRERIARPEEAEALLAALPDSDRALWATALYAGLRRGELLALDWAQVDLEGRLLRVERSWDRVVGVIDPKSGAGKRRVPIPAGLRAILREHRLRQSRGGSGLVFGRTESRPFEPASVAARARAAWANAGLTPIGLHECRHTYASFMIAAGVNAKSLSTYMGHSTITITLDRYGHLLPGNEHEAAALLDGWLAGAD